LAGYGGKFASTYCVDEAQPVRAKAALHTIRSDFTDYLHGFVTVNGLDSSAGDFKSGGYFRILQSDFTRLRRCAFDRCCALKGAILGSICMAAMVANSANTAESKQSHKGIDSVSLHFTSPTPV
jgi:hypothetical protein